jgi:short-subunit dehydrogenase
MSRPVAVISGTSSGIGLAISRLLLEEGWGVIGISRRVAPIDNPEYEQISLDLTQLDKLERVVEELSKREVPLKAVINNAGVGYFGPHEELKVKQLEELVKVNLLAPMVIARGFLRRLKAERGHLIAIGSFSAHESSSHGAAYSASKAGLAQFQRSVFDEARRSGVRVTTISPDITRTGFYDRLRFRPAEDEGAAVTAQCVARAVWDVLTARSGTVVSEVTLRPQRVLIDKLGG